MKVAKSVDQSAAKTVDEKVVVMAGHWAVVIVWRSDAPSVAVKVAVMVAKSVDQLAAKTVDEKVVVMVWRSDARWVVVTVATLVVQLTA